MTPSSSSITCSVLRSKWTMPIWCMNSSARASVDHRTQDHRTQHREGDEWRQWRQCGAVAVAVSPCGAAAVTCLQALLVAINGATQAMWVPLS